MAIDFDELAKQVVERMGVSNSAKDHDDRYALEIEDSRGKTHTMFIQEGISNGCLEVFTTVADEVLHQEFLEIGLAQNLENVRTNGNIFTVDRETSCAILYGRYDPHSRDIGDFGTWLDEYLAEMGLYHEIADELNHSTLDRSAENTDKILPEFSIKV
ncbi:hypothetical protein CCP4SC76_3010024 [Gammaproteobacteria bacterium]